MGVPCPHERSGIHPPHRTGTISPNRTCSIANRTSFPGILGRTCDRPCEPACRRGRVDGKPVAICRLKRVAADHRDDVTDFLPKAPHEKNGKRVALIGAGPTSLTVANDLMPLGYEVVIFEKLAEPGGLMRINIPSFRLPASVLDEEVGLHPRHGRRHPVQLARHEPARAARRATGTPCSSAAARQPERISTFPAAPRRRRTFTSASSGSRRRTSATSRRSASAC